MSCLQTIENSEGLLPGLFDVHPYVPVLAWFEEDVSFFFPAYTS